MRRREFNRLLGGAAAWPFAAHAQQAELPRLGVLLAGNREPFSTLFREGLRDVGYVEGKNIRVEFRWAEGKLNLLPELALELVRLKVDIIVASETPSVQAAKRATSEIPIVMAPSGDPVGTGLIASLAKPGGNVTGLSAATAELAGKSLELIREVLPGVRRVAALADPSNTFTKPFLEQIDLVARTLGVDIHTVMLNGTEEFAPAFAELAGKQIDAVIVQPTLPRAPIIALAQKYRLPSVSGNRAFAEAGGLMSYAGSLADRYRNAAPYVDRILKGAKPADLPVQQPTKFEFVINLKTAKAIGLAIPPALLTRADDVIE
ncbi:MAG: ABC transporter substrate-binding protein [bacterium]|nr:ABC transporter substrate-binding protein [bacterium]